MYQPAQNQGDAKLFFRSARLAAVVCGLVATLSWADAPQFIWVNASHSQNVNGVAVTPDGQTLMSASDDGTIKLWRSSDGHFLRTLVQPDRYGVRSFALSPDGAVFATGSNVDQAYVWDLATGSVTHTLRGHQGAVRALAFSPDGSTLASGGEDATLRLWNVSDGSLRSTLFAAPAAITCVAFSPDGDTVAAGSDDANLYLFSASSETLLQTLRLYSFGPVSVAFSPDGTYVAEGSINRALELWDVATGAHLADVPAQQGPVGALAFNSDGSSIFSGGAGFDDCTVRHWAIPDLETIPGVLTGHTGGIFSIALTADDRTLVSGSMDHTVRLWDVQTSSQTQILTRHPGGIDAIAVSPDGTVVASASDDFFQGPIGIIQLSRASDGALLRTLTGHRGTITALSYSGDGRMIASSSSDGTVRVYAVDTGENLLTVDMHHPAYSAVFSPDNRFVAATVNDGSIVVLKASDGTVFTTLRGKTSRTTSLAFLPDSRTVASASTEGIGLWDVLNGTVEFLTPISPSARVRVSRDGQYLASWRGDAEIKIWSLPQRAFLRHIRARMLVRDFVFSGDGRTLISSNYDAFGYALNFWDISDASLLLTLDEEVYALSVVASSPSGDSFAYGRGDGTVALATNPLMAPQRLGR